MSTLKSSPEFFQRIPPDLLRLILSKLSFGEVRKVLFSSKNLKNLWSGQEYWDFRGSQFLKMPIVEFRKALSFIQKLYPVMNRPRSLAELMFLMECRSQIMIDRIQEYTSDSLHPSSRISKYWEVKNGIETYAQFLEDCDLENKSSLVEKLESFRTEYYQTLSDLFLPNSSEELLNPLKDALRKYLIDYRRKHQRPRIIVLPNTFDSADNRFSLFHESSLESFTLIYLSRYRALIKNKLPKDIREKTYREIEETLASLKIHDIISFGPEDDQFRYIVPNHSRSDLILMTNTKYVFPEDEFDFFVHYAIEYNEDVNELYGIPDTEKVQWSVDMEDEYDICQEIPLASRKDSSEGKVVPYTVNGLKLFFRKSPD